MDTTLEFQSNFDPASCEICHEIGEVITNYSRERFTSKSKRIFAKSDIDSMYKVLQNLTIWELTEQWQRTPIPIYSGQKLQDALSLIAKFRVFSLPVLNENHQMIGSIDVMDICQELVAQSIYFIGSYDKAKIKDFLNKKIDSLFVSHLNNVRSTRSYVISANSTTLIAIKHMLQKKKDRFIVVNRDIPEDVEELHFPEENIQGIVSTIDILGFICKYPSWVRKEPFFHMKISELFNVESIKKPKIVHLNEVTSKVFFDMGDKGFSGVGIVDNDGKLISNLSPSDLKGITLDNYEILNEPLELFLAQDNSRGWWSKPVTVDLDSTFYECICSFVYSRIHRVYLVDADEKPTGVLNHRDMLEKLLFFIQPT